MTEYEYRKMVLMACLGSYRSAGPEIRSFVDLAMAISRRCAETEEDKRLHNLLVLRFIAGQSFSVNQICKALHVSRSYFRQTTDVSIDRLMVVLFGLDGVEWA